MPRKPRRKDPFDRMFKPALLRSESPSTFKRFHDAIYREIAPQTPIERFATGQLIRTMWESERLHALGAAVLTGATLSALQTLIAPTSVTGIDTDLLVQEFFSTGEARREVRKRLSRLGLTEADVEAEAFRLRVDAMQAHNRLLVSTQKSWAKQLGTLQDYRARAQKQGVAQAGNNGRRDCETAPQARSVENEGVA